MKPPPSQEGCPIGGVHRTSNWTGKRQTGVVCIRCHKTWTATVDGFVPTFPDGEERL